MKKVQEEANEVEDENEVKGVVDKVVKVFKGMREQLSPTIQKNVKVEVMEEGIDKEIVSIVHSVFVVISMDILFINVGAILTLMLKRK